MENEIMENIEEVNETMSEVVTESSNNIGTVALVALGLTGIGFAVFKLGKQVREHFKSKKEQKESQELFDGIDDEIEGIDK